MSNTYTWKVTNLTGYPQYEGESDVITIVTCDIIANDGNGHTASIQTTQQTPLDPAAPFIPYPDLTNEIVVGWVQNVLGPNGVASFYANLDSQIEAQVNPPVELENFPLPWGASAGTTSDYIPPAVRQIVGTPTPELVYTANPAN